MAFLIANWGRASVSANEPILSLTSGTVVGAPRIYTYYSADSQVTIAAANYFAAVVNDLAVGDIIIAYSSSGLSTVQYQVSSLTPASALISVVISGFGSMIKAQGSFLSAAFINSGAVPIQLLPAPGANRLIVVSDFTLEIIFGAAQYANGNPVGLEYGNTANLGGTAASPTIAAASINGVAANSSYVRVPGALAISVVAAVVNQGIFLSYNQGGAAFITGDGDFAWSMNYSIMVTT